VEQEIDKLCDLDVIDGNLWLVLRRDDEVLLLDAAQFLFAR